jgi:hypothetical protein
MGKLKTREPGDSKRNNIELVTILFPGFAGRAGDIGMNVLKMPNIRYNFAGVFHSTGPKKRAEFYFLSG